MILDQLDAVIISICNQIGADQMQLRLVFVLLVSIPLGFIFRFLKGSFIRHLYGIFFGFLFQYFVYRNDIISIQIHNIIVYLICTLTTTHIGKIVTIFSILFVMSHHIYGEIYDDARYLSYKYGVTTILMVNIVRWASFAYCIQDGKTQHDLSSEQQLKKIEIIPSYFEYFSYMTFFPTAIIGPGCDYYDFSMFINREGDYQNIPFKKSVKHTIKLVIYSIIYFIIFFNFYPKVDAYYCLTDDFNSNYNILQKLTYVNLSLMAWRCSLYFVWSLCDAGVTASGLSYNAQNKQRVESWDRVILVNSLKVEMMLSVSDKMVNWNIPVQKWLKNYVYLRLYSNQELKDSKKKQEIAQLFTLMVSAIWHGFYPGYLITFFQWSLIQSINKCIYKWNQNYPKFFQSLQKIMTYPVYWTLAHIINTTIFSLTGTSFQVLDLDRSIKIYNSTYWIAQIFIILIYIFFAVTKMGQRPPQKIVNKND